MLNVIIPLGGLGERFARSGYSHPKPLIKVGGLEILFRLLDSLSVNDGDNIFIPYNSAIDAFNIRERVKLRYGHKKNYNITMFPISNTNGACETVMTSLPYIKDKSLPCIVLDGDNYYTGDILSIARELDCHS